MATEEQSRVESSVFGYTFANDPDAPKADQSSQPPSGPPLLTNADNQTLQDFFNNPPNTADYDPHLLALQDENTSFLGNFTPSWMSDSRQATTSGPQQQQQPHYNSYATNGDQADPTGPSQDEYAAARYLHDQQNAHASNKMQPGSDQQDNGQTEEHTMDQHQPSDSRGTPPLPSLWANAPYNFPPREASKPLDALAKGASYRQNGRRGDGGEQENARNRQSLNFGSDKEFQRESYTGPEHEYPDAQLNQFVAKGLFRSADPAEDKNLTSPHNRNRKRRRRSVKAEDSTGEIDESYEDQPAPRRRKSLAFGDVESSGNKSRGGRRPGTGIGQTSSSNADTMSPSVSKPPRENLSEEQKRSNHILSEQKRRNVIKQGFEDINHMVPGLRANGSSKSNMLLEAASFLRRLDEGNEQMRQQLGSLDGEV